MLQLRLLLFLCVSDVVVHVGVVVAVVVDDVVVVASNICCVLRGCLR